MTTAPPRDYLYYAYAKNARGLFDVFRVRRVDGRLVHGEPDYRDMTIGAAEDRVALLNKALAP